MTLIQAPDKLTELGTISKVGAANVKAFLKGLGADAGKVDAAVDARDTYEAAVANAKDREKFLAYAHSVDETVTADNLNDLIKDRERTEALRKEMAMKELGVTDEAAFNELASNEALLSLYRENLPKLLNNSHMTNAVAVQFIGIILVVAALAYFLIQAMDLKPRAKVKATNPKTAKVTSFLLNYALFIILAVSIDVRKYIVKK